MKKNLFKVSLITVLLVMTILVTSVCAPVKVKADTPYKTYTVDGYGSTIETQTAYLPYTTITKIGEESLK